MPSLDRRTLVTGSVIAGLGTTAIAGLVAAQDATPSAEDTTTTTDTPAEETTTDLTARLQTQLDSLTTDLESVRDDIDATTIDTLVSEATAAMSGIATADEPRRAAAATATLIRGAGLLLDAQLEYAGLPSQEARSSRVLAAAYTAVTDSSDLTSATIDTSLYTATAQTLYTSAYDLYGSSAWAQAATTARAAGVLATGAAILLGTASDLGKGPLAEHDGLGIGMGPGNDDRVLGGMRDRRTDDAADTETATDDPSTPVTVPAPDFPIG